MTLTTRLSRVTAVVGFALALVPGAKAASVNYNFSVTATAGPLNGTTASGTFSYDSSSIVPGGTNSATGLLTALNFTWDGITYDRTTANTGALVFDSTGTLTNVVFGNNCVSNSCSVTSAGLEQIAVGKLAGFSYSKAGVTANFQGTVTVTLSSTPTPPPATPIRSPVSTFCF